MNKKPKVSDIGMTAKCRKILAAIESNRKFKGWFPCSLVNKGLKLLFADEWCKANDCEFAARQMGKPYGVREWRYLVERVNYSHREEGLTPIAAVHKMQKWMAENPE